MTLLVLTVFSAAALVGFFDRSSRRRSRRALSSAESAARASIFFASVLAFSAASAFPTAVAAFQVGAAKIGLRAFRSEEHTSELQSLMRNSYAVFCLKKKKIKSTQHKQQRKLLTHTIYKQLT